MKDVNIKVMRNWFGKRVILSCVVECDGADELRSLEASIITLLGQISVIDFSGEEESEEEEESDEKPAFGFSANIADKDELVGDGEPLVGYDDGTEPFEDEEEYYEDEEEDE